MRKSVTAALLAFCLVTVGASPAFAAPCKDAKGKFVKCPPKPAPVIKKKGPCKDARGKFVKCK